MGWRRCCCGGGARCGFGSSVRFPFSFGFQSLTGFTQDSGSWSISGSGDSSFVTTSDDFAALKMNAPHPSGATGNRAVSCAMAANANGGQVRLCFDCVDEDNYACVEMERVSSGRYLARIVERSGGSDTTVGDDVEMAIEVPIVAYYTPSNGAVRVLFNNFKSMWRTVTAPGGSRVAVATGDLAGSSGDFSSFEYSNYIEPELPECNPPNCAIYGLPPVSLVIPLGGEPNDFDWDLTGVWTVGAGGHNRTADGTAVSHFYDDSQDTIENRLDVYIQPTGVFSGDIFEIWFDYLDSDNYHIVRIDATDDSCKVFKVTGGSESEIQDLTADFPAFGSASVVLARPITICISGESCWVTADTTTVEPYVRETIEVNTTLHGGRTFGVKADVAIGCYFDCAFSIVNCTGEEDLERPCDCCEPEEES